MRACPKLHSLIRGSGGILCPSNPNSVCLVLYHAVLDGITYAISNSQAITGK